jgi:hypothetical protein
LGFSFFDCHAGRAWGDCVAMRDGCAALLGSAPD